MQNQHRRRKLLSFICLLVGYTDEHEWTRLERQMYSPVQLCLCDRWSLQRRSSLHLEPAKRPLHIDMRHAERGDAVRSCCSCLRLEQRPSALQRAMRNRCQQCDILQCHPRMLVEHRHHTVQEALQPHWYPGSVPQQPALHVGQREQRLQPSVLANHVSQPLRKHAAVFV